MTFVQRIGLVLILAGMTGFVLGRAPWAFGFILSVIGSALFIWPPPSDWRKP